MDKAFYIDWEVVGLELLVRKLFAGQDFLIRCLLPLLVFFQSLYLRLQTHHAAVEKFESLTHL